MPAYIETILFSFIGGGCFAIVYKIPRRYFIHATLVAMLARLGMEGIRMHLHIAYATFITAGLVAVASHVFARATNKPAQMFLIPGVILLVPGISVFKFFTAMLEKKFSDANLHLVDAIACTFAISFAILLANWIVPSKRTL